MRLSERRSSREDDDLLARIEHALRRGFERLLAQRRRRPFELER